LAPVIEGVFDPASIRFQDAEGHDVAFTANQGPGLGCGSTYGQWAELVPQSPLAPNTRYSIAVEPSLEGTAEVVGPNSVSFTTGDTLVPERTLSRPEAKASVLLDVPASSFGCSFEHVYVCLFADDPQEIELIARRGDEVLLRWLLPRIDSAGSPLEGLVTRGTAPDCLEFRRRNANGQRSEPLTLCGDQLPTRSYRDEDGSEVVACRDGKVGADAPAAPPTDSTAHAMAAPSPDADGGTIAAAEISSQAPAAGSGCAVATKARDASWFEVFVSALAAALLVSRRRKHQP
jgi:hypothetical protein